jgi:hypothetical protein
MATTNRIEELRMEGLVVNGDHFDVKQISVSKDGERTTVDVRPIFLPRVGITVLRPARGQSQVVYQA